MIDIQNHLRNEGLLNLFDGRSRAPSTEGHSWDHCSQTCTKCGVTWVSVMEGGSPKCGGPVNPYLPEDYRRKLDDLAGAMEFWVNARED